MSANTTPRYGIQATVFFKHHAFSMIASLTIGTVRSILTRNALRPARRFTAAMVRPILRFMLRWATGIPLSTHPLFIGALRDFSVTGRIGELAQGVAWTFWHWDRNYPIITDLVGWAPTVGIAIPAEARTPDYVMWNATTGDFALTEAKGTMGATHTSQMARALHQCRVGLPYCMAQCAFACILTLNVARGGHPIVPATLHIRDPERPAKTST